MVFAIPCVTGDPARAQSTVVQHGEASVYSNRLHGRMTATGDRYDPHALTAASRELPLGASADVTNVENGKRVTVKINDRGPYAKKRVIDLSRAAATRLGIEQKAGVALVKVEAHAAAQPTPELKTEISGKAAAQYRATFERRKIFGKPHKAQ